MFEVPLHGSCNRDKSHEGKRSFFKQKAARQDSCTYAYYAYIEYSRSAMLYTIAFACSY